MDKRTQLLAFIQERSQQHCEQGSEEWHELRKHSFGGSDMASLMGLCTCKYINQTAFIAEKIHKLNNTATLLSNIQMDWGTFFEPIHRHVMTDMFKAQIYEATMV